MTVPAHYLGRGNLTPWDVIDAFDLPHYSASAVEYILRAGRKTPDQRGDWSKAIACLNRAIECYGRRAEREATS